MLKGVIFDFDGVISDTESFIYNTWVALYRQYGFHLPISLWIQSVGTNEESFDPAKYLSQLMNQSISEERLSIKFNQSLENTKANLYPMPGVKDFLNDLTYHQLSLAIASSSSLLWVKSLLIQFGMDGFFQSISTREDVTITKPYPYLYQDAMKKMGLFPSQVVALEDSEHGIIAAKAAGIFTIAVKSPLSSYMRIDHADQVIPSLEGFLYNDLNNILRAPIQDDGIR
jgi:HAD superfamily hydrolase (TIGR01509 family)